MSDTALVYDATNVGAYSIPAGQRAAGYTTGSGGIAWAAATWAAHPGAVRIDQDAGARDTTADILDVETQAATPAECPGWIRAARASYASAARPGQRQPAIYCNGSTLAAVCNALIAGGVTSAPIWIARPGIPQVTAHDAVTNASGPFPIIGVQYYWGGTYDISVFSLPWLTTVSGGVIPPPPLPSVAFPYPATDYLGETCADPHCHSGYNTADQPHIRTWQQQMAGRGWAITADGHYGPQSARVCAAFQSDKGLTADAKVGPVTWRAAWTAPVT